jgi:prepilin-type N-terminal cleavage/methylation domain-containing protein
MKMKHRARLLFFQQAGFTLVELLVAVAVTGIILSGITSAIFHVTNVSIASNNQMQTLKEVEAVIDQMRVDIQMAQTISYGVNEGFPLTLNRQDWDGNYTEIKYTLVSGELQRKQTINNDVGHALLRTVGNNIDSIVVNSPSDSNAISITISSKISGYKTTAETRTFEIYPRSGS